MKENENEKKVVRITDGNLKDTPDILKEDGRSKTEKLKKPVIFGLMGVIFFGCMYLIFKPSSDKKTIEDIGLNDAVPQASEAGLQSDKQKAYEQEILEQKMKEKQSSLTSLSDYWNIKADEEKDLSDQVYAEDYEDEPGASNPAMSSYRNTRNTLNSFYEEPDYETEQLRKQIEELKNKLDEKDIPPVVTTQDQLALMEKSYEMAAKYLPSNTVQTGQIVQSAPPDTAKANTATQKEHFVAFTSVRKNTVSSLYREPTDSAFLERMNEDRNLGFYTAGHSQQVSQPKNSIRAVVQQTQTITGESGVRLRLMEDARTPGRTIPKGTLLTANAKFQNGRLQLKISSIELDGNIIPVDLSIYDLDGQQGLNVPYSPEMNALTEMAGNMSQQSGTSLMMTQSAGQQMAADLSRGVVQGVSGYFSKKVKTQKVIIKAGHQVFLVSKK